MLQFPEMRVEICHGWESGLSWVSVAANAKTEPAKFLPFELPGLLTVSQLAWTSFLVPFPFRRVRTLTSSAPPRFAVTVEYRAGSS